MSAVPSFTSARRRPLKQALGGVLVGLLALALAVALSLSTGSATLAALATAVLLALIFAAHRLHLMLDELNGEAPVPAPSRPPDGDVARHALAMHATGDGVWDWNPVSDELFLSAGALALLDERAGHQLTTGTAWLERVHEDDRAHYRDALVAHLKGGTPHFECEYRVRDALARYRWLRARGLAQRDAHGSAVRMVGSFGDVGARKAAEARLQERIRELVRRETERTAELEATLQELASFSYSVSHDLRTPLRAIDRYSAALLSDHGERLDPDAWLLLEHLRSGVRRMDDVIDDLLELSRVTRYPLQREHVDLTALAARVMQALRETDPRREVALEIAPDLHVDADPRMLRIALEHLLGNAWKFTARTEHARVRVGRTTDAAAGFYVEDNGAGFDMALADRLFVPFQRLHPDGEWEGTGIGLAIVARIVQRHGGRVWASSRFGAATRFTCTLGGPAARNK